MRLHTPNQTRSLAGWALALTIRLLGLALLTGAFSSVRAQTSDSTVHYRLTVTRSSSHLAEVEIGFQHSGQAPVRLALPSWTPGHYQILDYARLIQGVSARDANGRDLPVEKIAKQTWEIRPTGAGRISLSYKVYANTLSDVFSQVNDHHSSILGAATFMYLVDGKTHACQLTLNYPPGWTVFTGLKRVGERSYSAPNYDVLIDAPIEIGSPVERKFIHGTTQYHIVMDYINLAPDPTDVMDQFVADIQRIVSYQVEMMGGAPAGMDHYYFLIHFDPGADYGLEHLNSTQLGISHNLTDQTSGDNQLRGIRNLSRYDLAIYLVAHEFFHLWNVKRIRPLPLGPFDYSREVHTKDLWISEGLTEYYGFLSLLRSGFWTLEHYLGVVSSVIEYYENHPAKTLRTVEETSWDTWFRGDYGDDSNFDDSWYSYYRKGDVLGLLLDFQILDATRGNRGLEDVCRLMYQRYPYEGAGYPEGAFLAAVNEISGKDFTPFFNASIRGKSDLDYTVLNTAGILLDREAKEGSYLGLEVKRGKNDQVVVRKVLPASPAMLAGVDRGDILVALDRVVLSFDDWDRVMATKTPGQKVQFQVATRGRLVLATANLTATPESAYRLKLNPETMPAGLERRISWERGVRQKKQAN